MLTEVHYDTTTGKLQVQEDRIPNEKNKFKRFFMRNINILSLQGRDKAIGKREFMEGARKMPFVFDLMRAESFWQDRKREQRDAKPLNVFGSQSG